MIKQIKCPKCGSKMYYRAFTLDGDIYFCLQCRYRTDIDNIYIKGTTPKERLGL